MNKRSIQKPETVLENKIKINALAFCDENKLPNPGQKKQTCHPVDFDVPADESRIKESEKLVKNLDFAKELKKKKLALKVTVIPIILRAHGTIPKN